MKKLLLGFFLIFAGGIVLCSSDSNNYARPTLKNSDMLLPPDEEEIRKKLRFQAVSSNKYPPKTDEKADTSANSSKSYHRKMMD